MAAAEQRQQDLKARLLHTTGSLCAAEVVEHHRYWRGGDVVLQGNHHVERGEDLNMPAARLHTLRGGFKTLARKPWITGAAGMQIDAHAAYTRRMHEIEFARRHLLTQHGDAPRISAACAHAVERGCVISAIDARRDNHHAPDAKRLMQRRHFVRQRRAGGVEASGEIRKCFNRTVDMRMAIAGIGGHDKVQRRCRLRRLDGKAVRCRVIGIAHRKHFLLNAALSPRRVSDWYARP